MKIIQSFWTGNKNSLTDSYGEGHGDRYIGSLFRVDEPVPDDSRIDARYNLGLTNATKIDAVKIHNRVVQLTVGYRFEL